MSDHSFMMTAHSVNQTLAGDKVQTRRVVTRSNTVDANDRMLSKDEWSALDLNSAGLAGGQLMVPMVPMENSKEAVRLFPRIRPGDKVRIKEGWAVHLAFDDFTPTQVGEEYKDNPDRSFPRVYYKAANPGSALRGRWRSPLFMPKWASRIRPLIKSVRFEWLQDIGVLTDIPAEGISPWHDLPGGAKCGVGELRARFNDHWNRINLKRGYPFKDNPLVLRYEYEVR